MGILVLIGIIWLMYAIIAVLAMSGVDLFMDITKKVKGEDPGDYEDLK